MEDSVDKLQQRLTDAVTEVLSKVENGGLRPMQVSSRFESSDNNYLSFLMNLCFLFMSTNFFEYGMAFMYYYM